MVLAMIFKRLLTLLCALIALPLTTLLVAFIFSFFVSLYVTANIGAMDYHKIEFTLPKNIEVYDKLSQDFVAIKPQSAVLDKTLLSVVIPIHNVENYLRECLDSVVQKSKYPYEVILIENNSTDRSLEIAIEYAVKYDNITLIKQDGGGLGGARNTGMVIAQGEYITFIDSDDYFTADAIDVAIDSVAVDKPDVVIFSFNTFDHTTRKLFAPRWLGIANNTTVRMRDYEPLRMHDLGTEAVWSHLYKRKILQETGIFFRERMYYEDRLFKYMLYTHDLSIKFMHYPLIYYRIGRPGSITTAAHVSHMLTVFDEFKDFTVRKGLAKEYRVNALNNEVLDIMKFRLPFIDIREAESWMMYLHIRYSALDYMPDNDLALCFFNDIKQKKYSHLIGSLVFNKLCKSWRDTFLNIFY